MRELIYLSDRKLAQFVDSDKAGRRRRVNQIGATAPMGLGGLQIGLSESKPGGHPRLAEVIAYLDKADPAPKQYTDDDLQPGQWVRFTATMNYQVFRDPDALRHYSRAQVGPPALLFWDPQPRIGTGRLEVPSLDAIRTPPWPTRLLLHGSPEHLIGARADQLAPAESRHMDAMSLPIGLVEFLTGLSRKSFSQALWFTLESLDDRYPAEIAAKVTGYARVTASVEVDWTPFHAVDGRDASRVVVASPLFVELAR